MGRNVLTVIVAAAILFAIAVAGAALVVITGAGASLPVFSDQVFWWSLGIACLAIPVESILWKAGTVGMVGGTTLSLLAAGWVMAISMSGGLSLHSVRSVNPGPYFTAAIVATLAMVAAWVAFGAVGRRLSRGWARPARVLAVLGYWILVGAAFAYPWVYLWVPQFYADMLAAPTTGLFMLMEGPYYPVVIYHTLLGISLGLFIASVGALRMIQRRRGVTEGALKK